MTPKALIFIGLAWFVAVLLWLRLGPRSLFHTWQAKGATKRVTLTAAIYFFGFLYQILVIGWLVPLVFGGYRLLRHQ